ncbi:MAG: hypothetical protein AVDCRST_MAG68-2156, partial [uncultured Gemmatimonadetes bacterium]
VEAQQSRTLPRPCGPPFAGSQRLHDGRLGHVAGHDAAPPGAPRHLHGLAHGRDRREPARPDARHHPAGPRVRPAHGHRAHRRHADGRADDGPDGDGDDEDGGGRLGRHGRQRRQRERERQRRDGDGHGPDAGRADGEPAQPSHGGRPHACHADAAGRDRRRVRPGLHEPPGHGAPDDAGQHGPRDGQHGDAGRGRLDGGRGVGGDEQRQQRQHGRDESRQHVDARHPRGDDDDAPPGARDGRHAPPDGAPDVRQV